MIRRLFFVLTALLLAGPTLGQYYYQPYINAGCNPGKLNTEPDPVPELPAPVGWTRLLTGSAPLAYAPVWAPVRALPTGFDFNFNGQPVTHFKVSSNGILTFDTAAAAPSWAWQRQRLPNPALSNRSVCVWGYLSLDRAGSSIWTKTFGTAPNRQLWVQFREPRANGNLRQYWGIVLEETTDVIYIVEQFLNASAQSVLGVQVDSTMGVSVAGDSINPTAPVYTMSTQYPSPDDNTYYAFLPGQRPTRDLNVQALRLPRTLGPAPGPQPLTVTLYNFGAQRLSNCTLNYSIDGGAAQSAPITGLNMAPGDSLTLTHPVAWNPPAGDFRLRVWAGAPNGLPDQQPLNDTLTTTIHVAARTVTRRVLQEVFTSSTCPYCRPFNDSLQRYNRRPTSPPFVHLSYQQNIPGPDPYTTPETIARYRLYGAYGAPAMKSDGQTFTDARYAPFDSTMHAIAARPAYLDLQVSYQVHGDSVTATAQVLPHAGLDPNRWRLYFVIAERSTRNNARTNGETVFYDVVKKMLPDQNGTLLPALASGQLHTQTLSYVFPAGHTVESFDSLDVVAFVQNPYSRQVLQATRGLRDGVLATAPAAAEQELAFELVPNPAPASAAAIRLHLPRASTVTAEVFNALGQRVFSAAPVLPAGLHSLPLKVARPGVYSVRVRSDRGPAQTRRLLVE